MGDALDGVSAESRAGEQNERGGDGMEKIARGRMVRNFRLGDHVMPRTGHVPFVLPL